MKGRIASFLLDNVVMNVIPVASTVWPDGIIESSPIFTEVTKVVAAAVVLVKKFCFPNNPKSH